MSLGFKTAILEYLFKLIAPELIQPQKLRVKAEEFDLGDSILKKLRPGDIIFTQTPSIISQMLRNVVGMQYDHVCVVLNPRQAIHISPPRISRLNLRYVTLPRQHPLIIRPNLTNPDKFLSELHMFLGEKYSYESVMDAMMKFVKRGESSKLDLEELREKRICSNVVMYCMCVADEEVRRILDERLDRTTYQQLGMFFPDAIFNLLSCYPKAEIIHKEVSTSYNSNKLLFQEIGEIVRSKESKQTKLLNVFRQLANRLEGKANGFSIGKAITIVLAIISLKRILDQSIIFQVVRSSLTMVSRPIVNRIKGKEDSQNLMKPKL